MRSVLFAVTLVMMCANGAFAWNGSKAADTSAKSTSGPNTSVGKKVDSSLGDMMLTEKYRYTKTSYSDTRRQQKRRN